MGQGRQHQFWAGSSRSWFDANLPVRTVSASRAPMSTLLARARRSRDRARGVPIQATPRVPSSSGSLYLTLDFDYRSEPQVLLVITLTHRNLKSLATRNTTYVATQDSSRLSLRIDGEPACPSSDDVSNNPMHRMIIGLIPRPESLSIASS